jgi:hypothetical protein
MFMDDWTRQDAFWTLLDGARDEMLRIVSTRMTKKDLRWPRSLRPTFFSDTATLSTCLKLVYLIFSAKSNVILSYSGYTCPCCNLSKDLYLICH